MARIQAGLRIDRRLLKVLKGLAEFHELTVGEFLEGVVLAAFAGAPPLTAEAREIFKELSRIYGLDPQTLSAVESEDSA